ncbi:unnamed protein product [Penicillium salamii]|nr:unnamed protein product [Penicillium salamii]CAG8227807.1 unnamed protein product [Penicillium salamii]CAG8329044.1 unnamed protein product [Penicillium salamii]
MPPKEKYTDPELRDEVKEEIHNGDKGGKPGQWSARKAQMMASEYKKRGGEYNTTKEEGQSESQKHLDDWTKEEWQTKEGEGTARQDDDSRKRYLPKKAWEELSEGEKEGTDEKKVEESKEGKQFVGNTGEAKEARRRASVGSGDEGQKGEDDEDAKGKGEEKEEEQQKDDDEDDEGNKDDDQTDESNKQKKETPEKDDGDSGEQKQSEGKGAGDKRTAKQDTSPNKKQKDTARMKSLRKRE